MKKSRIAFWIIYPLISLIFSLIIIFVYDLTNGPMFLFIFNLIAIAVGIFIRIMLRNKKFVIRMIPTLAILLTTSTLLSLSKPISIDLPAVDYANSEKTAVLETLNGGIQGVYTKDMKVEVYCGVPYAKAPIGELRWKEPQDLENWTGVKDCSYFGSRAMQEGYSPVMSTLIDLYSAKGWHPDYRMHPVQSMSEDCLYLNIWKPHTEETNLPILIYIHGGSLSTGTAAFYEYNGEAMAHKGVIQVNVGYRLNIFGYFASEELQNESPNHTTGNYGLLDQIKAIKWVHDNALKLGGNPDNITICGESAGSSSISAICASPLASGLFKKAIGESSSLVVSKPPHTFRSLETAISRDRKLYEEFNAKNIEDLRKVPAEELVKYSASPEQMTLDGYALTKMPYQVYMDHENNEEVLLNGFNVKEADAFVVPTFLFNPTNKDNIRERLVGYFNEETANKMMNLYKDRIEKDAFSVLNEIVSVYWFMQPHDSWTKAALEAGTKVYKYQFTKENGFHGNYHSGELPDVFGNLSREYRSFSYNQSDYDLSEKMLNYWSSFAKNGDPNYEGGTNWPEYNLLDKKIMELGSNVGLINDPYLDLYPIIEEYIENK